MTFKFKELLMLFISSVCCTLAFADDEKSTLEAEITALESRLEKLEANNTTSTDDPSDATQQGRRIFSNDFNPSIGFILNGRYSDFSGDSGEIAGFAVGEEGERGSEGFSLGESELNISANIDDKFFGSATAAIVQEDGESIIELEEAYVQTLPGVGWADGLNAKFGRAFWTLGYLNEHHSHSDDFADRPLPYRAFLNKAFNDDGVEFSYVLPTEFYAEVGAGAFRGDDFPFGGAESDGAGAWSAFGRVGGDFSANQNWRAGIYTAQGEADAGRDSNEDAVTFVGDSDLYAVDVRYTYAPTGNPRAREWTLQAEYFMRDEDGTYEDMDAATGAVVFDDDNSGWYTQVVYKFRPQWRVGVRYSELDAADVPAGLVGSALDSGGHDANAYAAMIDWTNSEFSRLRLQYNHEELSDGQNDDQIILQYIASLGAHGAHKY